MCCVLAVVSQCAELQASSVSNTPYLMLLQSRGTRKPVRRKPLPRVSRKLL
jgi:hypothetical protein